MFAALIPLLASVATQLPGLFKKQGAAGAEAAAAPAEGLGLKGLFSLGNMANLGATAAKGALDQGAQKKAQLGATANQLQANAAQPMQAQAVGDPNLPHMLAALQRMMASLPQQTPPIQPPGV